MPNSATITHVITTHTCIR